MHSLSRLSDELKCITSGLDTISPPVDQWWVRGLPQTADARKWLDFTLMARFREQNSFPDFISKVLVSQRTLPHPRWAII